MSGFITIRDTNKQLCNGVVPSSLDTGFIPSAEKLEECLKQRVSPNSTAEQQAEKLLEEIKSSSQAAPPKKHGKSLYVIDDYDSDEECDAYSEHVQYREDHSDSDIKPTSSLPSGMKKKSNSKFKISRMKDVFKSKLSRN